MADRDKISKLLILGLLVFPGAGIFARSEAADEKKTDVSVTVSVRSDDAGGESALLPLAGAEVRFHLSDGSSLEMISSDMSPVIFKDLPAGCEYVAEISCEGYAASIVHGRVKSAPGSREDFHTVRAPAGTAASLPPFKDSGVADIEGFVVCPAGWNWVTEPLSDAIVLYTSAADSVYTTTDIHGYFRFDGIKDKSGKIAVSHLTCRSAEVSTVTKDGSRWLWIVMEQDPLQLISAKITSSMPVISMVGDTIRYNVAATQKVAYGDRLGDVLERLPGIAVEGGEVKVMGRPLAEINVNDSELFGHNRQDALKYLAGQQIKTIDVYENEEDVRNSPGHAKRLIMNVKTKRILHNVTDVDISAAGGADNSYASLCMPRQRRWQTGFGARYFSVPLTASIDAGVNNIGMDSGQDISKLPDAGTLKSELARPIFAMVKVQKALELNKAKTRAVQTLGFNWSFKKKETGSEKETMRSYGSDSDWTAREFASRQHSAADAVTHRAELKFRSGREWHPHATLAYSRNESVKKSDFFSTDRIRYDNQGYNVTSLHQISELEYRNYRVEGSAGISSNHIKNLSVSLNLSFHGGEGDGSELRNDSTATTKTRLTSDIGRNTHVSANASVIRLVGQKSISGIYIFDYDNGLQHRFNYDEVADDAHLSPLTSEQSLSNVYRHTVRASYTSRQFGVTAGFQSAHVLDSRELPYAENIDKVFPAPVASVIWRPLDSFSNKLHISVSTNAFVPTLDQLGSVFHDSNPLFVSRGNPDLKQMHTFSVSVHGSNMIAGGTLDYDSRLSYRINEIVATRTYYAEETAVDGYTFPAGATFSTYANSTGGLTWDNSINHSAFILPLRYKLDCSAGYVFSKTPSSVNGRFEHYITHKPFLNVNAKSNFSARYRLDLSLDSDVNLTESQYYGAMKYGDISASVSSDNRLTDWLFIRAGYRHYARIPMCERAVRMDTDMLNVSAGVYLMKSRLCIAMIFRDMLDDTPSVVTNAYSNYLETVAVSNLNRYVLLSVRYLFNSSDK